MREEFEKLVATGKINRQHLEPLVALATGGYCFHRSWGFGRITTVDMVFCRFTIDFPSKPGHTMDLTFAAESLRAIPGNHILARKASDLESLRKMAAFNHLDLVKLVLQSYDGKATLEQLHQVLVPDVIADDWKKWWEGVKREIKKDGHFILPAKKSDPIIYQIEEVSLQDRLMGELRAAKGLKARIDVAQELQKNLIDLTDMKAAVVEVAAALNAEINTHQRTQPAVALEAIFLRDELRSAAGVAPAGDELAEGSVWALEPKFGPLLEQTPAAKHRRALESFLAANPEAGNAGLRSKHLRSWRQSMAGS